MSKTRNIFLILGDSCNMNCVYCSQHEIRNTIGQVKINPDIYTYIYQKAKLLPEDEPLLLTFFGGEPLLYWDTIKEIHRNLMRMNVKIKYGITTNGKLLDFEKVDYINKYNWRVGISWDGRNTLRTRGFDALTDKRNELLDINYLTISGVFSGLNYPYDMYEDIQSFDKEWYKKHKKHVHYTAIIDIPLSLEGSELLKNVDYDLMEEQVERLLKESIENREEHKLTIGFRKILEGILYDDQNNKKEQMARCGATRLQKISLSLDGKIWFCPSSRTLGGDIYTKESVLLQRWKKFDKTPKTFSKVCKECEVKNICKGGCPLIKEENRSLYCKAQKAFYRPFNKLKKMVLTINGEKYEFIVYDDIKDKEDKKHG